MPLSELRAAARDTAIALNSEFCIMLSELEWYEQNLEMVTTIEKCVNLCTALIEMANQKESG